MEINDILYTLRETKGLTQEELCRGLCSRSTYVIVSVERSKKDIRRNL